MTKRTLNRRTRVFAAVAAIVGLSACAVGLAQQVKKTRSAEIRAATMTYDWGVNTFEFAGDCHLQISGAYEATMTGPKMVARLNKKGDRVEHLTAAGPVHFEVVTQKDANGVRRKIVASSQGEATYEEATQTVALQGGAIADVTTLPATPDAESAHFEGDRIVADLKANTMKVDKPHMTVTTTPEEN